MDTLQASWPDSIRYANMQRQLVNAVILLRNKLRSHNRHAGVLNLVLARQLDFIIRMIEIACVQREDLPLHRALHLGAIEGLAIKIYRRFLKHSQAHDRPQCFVALRRRNQRHLLLDNTGLLHSDTLQRLAAAVSMVERHIRNNADYRRNNIRRIPQAAHADLDNCIINLLQIKIKEGRSCKNLKLRRLLAHALLYHTVRCHLHGSNCHREILIADVLAVQVNALVVFHQMGRGELAHLKVRCQQDIRNHARNGALAIRTRNMYGFELLLRIAQLAQKTFNALHA